MIHVEDHAAHCRMAREIIIIGLKNRHGHWLYWMSTNTQSTYQTVLQCEERTHKEKRYAGEKKIYGMFLLLLFSQ